MTSPRSSSTLEVSDGVTIAFQCFGTPRAGVPPIALVHSLAMDHRFWTPVIGYLVDHTEIITLDARGHGASGSGSKPFTAQRMADDLNEVLAHLQRPKAVVGGASMGGCIALQFAIDHPTRTAGLALIDTTAWYGSSAPQDWEDRATKARTQGLASLVAFQQTRWFSDGFRLQNPQLVQTCIDIFLENDIDSYVASCRMLGAFDARQHLSQIKVPTRVLVGEEDYAAPVHMALAMHEEIDDSRMEIIDGARHLTPLEEPETVATLLLKLCQEAAHDTV
ncbi:alpha/beta fold hydrolase [Comamonas testosteroni]|uniref:alpha/beta fold hydrolase n=1 Tax=Comamonas testosteroni TaxID=285 RepID=UPI0006B8AE95|nr:alpha/beta hydrolase [Comamonas testosteroni]